MSSTITGSRVHVTAVELTGPTNMGLIVGDIRSSVGIVGDKIASGCGLVIIMRGMRSTCSLIGTYREVGDIGLKKDGVRRGQEGLSATFCISSGSYELLKRLLSRKVRLRVHRIPRRGGGVIAGSVLDWLEEGCVYCERC